MKIKPTSTYKNDLKKYQHKKPVLQELDRVLKLLIKKKKLPEKYCDHLLSGKWNPARECHIKPDVLLIYQIENKEDILKLIRLGSHSDLFK